MTSERRSSRPTSLPSQPALAARLRRLARRPPAALAALLAVAPAAAAQCPLENASDPAGAAEADSTSRFPSLSATGRFVAFSSAATNLVAGDLNPSWDVFVLDRVTGTYELLTLDDLGGPANGPSYFPDISASGRWVAFESSASDLVGGDANLVSDVFRHDRNTGTNQLVTTGADQASYNPSISDDGRFVAFESYASLLVAGDGNGIQDVFVKDLLTGTVQMCSRPNAGGNANGESANASISGDGRYVAFESKATNLTGDATSNQEDVYVFDRMGAMGSQLTHVKNGAVALNGRANRPDLSFDGRWLVFDTTATNLPSPAALNSVPQVFLLDRATGTFTHVSRALLPDPMTMVPTWFAANSDARYAAISADGGRLAFYSFATNLFPNDLNLRSDQFTWDRATATLRVVSRGPADAASDDNAYAPAISASGQVVAWHTGATTLLGPGGDTNLFEDVYVQDCTATFQAFCAGDGSGTACPCGNSGSAGRGCANSVVAAGALLTAVGDASLMNDQDGSASVLLLGSGMPPTVFALYFQGTTQAGGGAGTLFGDGLRCAAGSVVRLGTKMNVSGASQYPAAGDQPISVRGSIAAPGTYVYQGWYRNAAAFCTPDGFNLTNGVQITWGA